MNSRLSLSTLVWLSVCAVTHAMTKSRVWVERKHLKDYKDFVINTTNSINTTNRSPKIYFPIFEMIEFPNEGCLTIDGLMGTCYARTECDLFHGITRGFCARGFGVCCFFQVSCGGSVTNNRTHFLSPLFPQSFNQEMRCQISVTLPSDACQVRLNFVRFSISNPKHSQCVVDALTIPHFLNLPVLCGNLTGQHIYMEANENRENLIIITTTGHERQRYWIIEIQFIQCNLLLKAPIGCLQYYTGLTGMVKTMNYDCERYIRDGVEDRECIMANLEYEICIRIETERCAIMWTPIFFEMGPSGVIASQRGDFCQENYITIDNARAVTTDIATQNLKSFDRFCGTALNIDRNNKTNISVISRTKPFRLGVTTAKPSFLGAFRGAALTYEQKVCIDAPSN